MYRSDEGFLNQIMQVALTDSSATDTELGVLPQETVLYEYIFEKAVTSPEKIRLSE